MSPKFCNTCFHSLKFFFLSFFLFFFFLYCTGLTWQHTSKAGVRVARSGKNLAGSIKKQLPQTNQGLCICSFNCLHRPHFFHLISSSVAWDTGLMSYNLLWWEKTDSVKFCFCYIYFNSYQSLSKDHQQFEIWVCCKPLSQHLIQTLKKKKKTQKLDMKLV